MKARIFAEENRKWWTLAAVSFGLFMIMLDNTIVNVALPSIQSSLGLKISELEWVVTGYALTFGALMLTGGKLADLLGRRRMFVVGLVIFTLSSLACGLAGSAGVLIGARVVQGVGAALMNPATLSIITVTFPSRQRGTAIGIWAGVSALALAIAAVSLVAFVLLEQHQRLPMLELALFRNRGFAGANAVMLLVGLAMFGVFFYVSLYVQQVLGYSPLQAGASFLPWTLLIILLAPQAGRLSDRIRPRPLVAGGVGGLPGPPPVVRRLG